MNDLDCGKYSAIHVKIAFVEKYEIDM